MFSGLTSIADLNQQFINFTNTITNLDNMQNSSIDPATISKECDEKITKENNESIPNIGLIESIDTQILNDIKIELNQTSYDQMSKDLENQLERLKNEKQKVKDLESELESMKEQHYKHIQLIESENNLKLKYLEQDIKKLQKIYDEKTSQLELIQQQKSTDNELIAPLATTTISTSNKVKWKKLHEEECVKSSKLHLLLDSSQSKIKEFECNISDQNEKWKVLYEQEVNKTTSVQFKLDDSLNTINKLETKTKELQNELDSAKININQMRIQQISIADEYISKINDLNIKVNDYDKSIKAIHQDYCVKIDKLKLKYVENENQVHINTESMKLTHQVEINQTISLSEDLRRLLESKEKYCTEIEQKNNVLTEKLKEIMLKYAEFKSKTSKSSHYTDEQLIELKKKLQDKDSEVLSLRLKMENTERTLSDLKLKLLDITERCSDSQREITKERELLEITINSNDHLETSIQTLENANSNLLQEYNENKKQLNDIIEKYSTLLSSQQNQERIFNEKLVRQQQISNEAITELQTELASLNIRLKAESQSSGNLDSYKKKAQLALKKANNATNELAIENESLKQSLSDNSLKLLECNDLLKLATESEQHWKDQYATLKINHSAIIERYEIDMKSIQENLNQAHNKLHLQIEHFEQYKALNSNKLNETFNDNQTHLQLPCTNVVVADDEINNSKAIINYHHHLNEVIAITKDDSTCPPTDVVAAGAVVLVTKQKDKESQQQQQRSTWAITTSRSNSTIRNNKSIDLISDRSYLETNKDLVSKLEKPSEYLLLVNELQLQAELLKKEVSQRGIDVEATRQELQYEKEEKRLLSNKIEELLAFIGRSKRLNDGGPDSTVNMEYLKNCIFKYMSSTELSERKRLYPVISTILKLTSQELALIESAFAISEQRENEFENTFSTITNTFGSLWGK